MHKYILFIIIILCIFGLAGCNTTQETLDIDFTSKAKASKINILESPPENPIYIPVTEDDNEIKQVELKEEEKITHASLLAVGDILIHSSVYKKATTSEGYDFKPLFQQVKEYIQGADISIANQETMIGGTALGLSTYPRFNSPHEVGDALKDTGFDIVSLANNHTLDVGEKGVLSALDYWDRLEMDYTGAYRSKEDSEVIRTITKNDITFSFLSYTYGTNGIPVPQGKEYLVNLIDKEKMKKDIKLAKEMSDVVVMNLHFGQEYQRLPNKEQKQLAKEMADLGVDIIIGHHPHVLQPAEWIEREDGSKAFAIYSLGNFLSGQRSLYQEIGGMLKLHITKTTNGEDVNIEIGKPEFVSTWVNRYKKPYFSIEPLENVDPFYLRNAKGYYTEINKHMNQLLPDLSFPSQVKNQKGN